MKTSKLFLASMVLISLAYLSAVQGQYYPTPVEQNPSAYMVPAVSHTTGYLVGIVQSIRDENSMYVNFTKSNIPGMEGVTLILLPHPVPDLMYFQGKELGFSLLGHDIMGRPVCDAYFDGMPIDYYLTLKYGNYAPVYEYYPLWHGYYTPGYGFYPQWHGYYTPGYGYYSSGSLQLFEST
jgi:hypothetical protein